MEAPIILSQPFFYFSFESNCFICEFEYHHAISFFDNHFVKMPRFYSCQILVRWAVSWLVQADYGRLGKGQLISKANFLVLI